MSKWKSVGDGIWVCGYEAHGNPLNCTAIAIGEGNLAVVSAATSLAPVDYEELDAHGRVTALVVPGAYHNMGLPAWSARYPAARIYGPGPAAAHIAKLYPDLAPLEDFNALGKVLPPDVQAFEIDGCVQPDGLIVVRRADGITWVTNEILTNWPGWPKSFLFKMVFKLMGDGPGLNVNRMSLMFLKGKKPLVRASLEAKVAAHPPTRMIPGHGVVIEDPKLAERIGELLAKRL